MLKYRLLVIVFTYFFASFSYADSLMDGINAYEDGRDQEAFQHFKQAYLENNNNLIVRAFLQIFAQDNNFKISTSGLPKDIRKQSFYDTRTIAASFINTHFVSPAKNFRAMNQEELKYRKLIQEKRRKEEKKINSKEIKKIEKSLKKQGELIQVKINALKNLCDNGSRRSFTVLRKDLLKNKSLYLADIKNIHKLNDLFVQLASRYTIFIDIKIVKEIFPDIKNNYTLLLEKAIDLIYGLLLFFEAGYGSIEAIEEMSFIPEEILTSTFQYLVHAKPKYNFLASTMRKLILFYAEHKDIINNREELQLQLSNLYTSEENSLVDIPEIERPLIIHFNTISMKYLVCLGNISALEWISNNEFLRKNYNESKYFSQMGYDLGNLKCGFILASIIRHQQNDKALMSLYISLIEQCKNNKDAEYITEELLSFYFSNVKKNCYLLNKSCNELFKKALEISSRYNLDNYSRILQCSITIGIAYFLQNNDSTFCQEIFNNALTLYTIDPNSANLFILCQILSNQDWPHEKSDDWFMHAQKYLTLFLETDILINENVITNITETKGILASELANIYMKENKYEEAACYFEKAIQFGFSKVIVTYVTLRIFYLHDYHYDDIKKMLLTIVELNPNANRKDLKNGYFLLGMIELLNSNFIEADHCFEIASQYGSKDAILNRSITQQIITLITPINMPEIHTKTTIDSHDDSSSSDTEIIMSDDEEKDFDEDRTDFINEATTESRIVDSTQLSVNPLSLSTESLELSEIDLEPWKQFPPKKQKIKSTIQNSIEIQDSTENKVTKQKKIKIDRLIAELQERKINKRKMTKYLSQLLNLVDKEAYITSGEAVRVKFNVGDMVLPMHVQHPSAGNKVEAGRLKTIQTFVNALTS